MKVVIIHGWDGTPEQGWFPWLKKELENRSFEVFIPKMICQPPVMKEWVPHIAKIIGKPDEKTFLIGHSAGCITILKYLETLKNNEKIGGAVLVAGFTDDIGQKELENFFTNPIKWGEIKKHCNRFVAINSDNDEWVSTQHGEIFEKELEAELIIEHNKGHLDEDSGIFELPSVLEAVLKITKHEKI